MQNYWVQVFNQLPLNPFPGEDLLGALLGANYDSLCHQYGLDPQEISSTRARLEFITAPNDVAPFFLLDYRSEDGAPLVIYRWDAKQRAGVLWLEEAIKQSTLPKVKSHLAQTKELLAISLHPSHLADMGLILAYEVARWAAACGKGLVYGLDGAWYRLNRHRAFLPL